MSKRQGIETVKGGGKEYAFKMDFDALSRVEEGLGCDLMILFSGLSDSSTPSTDNVKTILMECIQSDNKKDDVDTILMDFGYQECWALAYTLLSHGMIGDRKKRQLSRANLLREAFDSVLMNTGLAPWRWALLISVFGGSVCGAISLYLNLLN